jgi:transposase, IS6 family
VYRAIDQFVQVIDVLGSEKRDLAATRRFFTRALGRLKARLRPMRGLKQLRCARVITTGHAFIQNIRRGHYELGLAEPTTLRVMAAFTELTVAI